MYSPTDMPVLNGLARAYGVCDEWFASVPSQTNTNRAYSLAGTSIGLVDNGFYTTDYYHHTLQQDAFNTPTMFNVLADNGVKDWAIYYGTNYPVDRWPFWPYTRNSFPQLELIPDIASHFRRYDDFYSAAALGKLPKFSYIEPIWGGALKQLGNTERLGNDYHPPEDITPGEYFVRKVYEALASNKKAWDKTLLLIVFDEHGGTYDHVPPPATIAPWDPGSDTIKPVLEHGFKFDRLGVRVPAIVVSPWVDPQTVFRAPDGSNFDHTSIIATVLEWMLPDKPRSSWGLGRRVEQAPTFDTVLTRSQARTDLAFAPRPPAPSGSVLNYGEPFWLAFERTDGGDASYFTQANQSRTAPPTFYPILGPTPVEMELRNGQGPVENGALVQVRTSEYLRAESPTLDLSHGLPIFLTAPSAKGEPCTFFNTDAQIDNSAQYWKIERVTNRSGPLLLGERVRLTSPASNGVLAMGDGNNVSTKAGSQDLWRLVPGSESRPVNQSFILSSGKAPAYHYGLKSTPDPNFAWNGPAFNAFAQPFPGTVPVYEYTITMSDPKQTVAYYYLLDPKVPDGFKPSKRNPIAFYAYAEPGEFRRPVNMFVFTAPCTTNVYYYGFAGSRPPAPFTGEGTTIFWVPDF